MGENDESIDRRSFLNWGWKVLGVGLAVEAGWTTYDILKPESSGAFGGVIDAGRVEAFPEGAVRYFLEGRFYVTSVQGSLQALYQKCPHLGCRVPFCDSSQRFECPCHGSVFNVKGEYLEGPSPRGMDRFEVRLDGDRVLVDTGNTLEGPARGVVTGPSGKAGPPCLEPSGEAPTQDGDTGHEEEGGHMEDEMGHEEEARSP